MKLISGVLVLLITQLTGWVSCEESSANDFLKNLKTCPGGYCIQRHLCRNGTFSTDGDNLLGASHSNYNEPLLVSLYPEDNEPCAEFLMGCCALEIKSKLPSDNASVSTEELELPLPSCGTNNPNQLTNSSDAQFGEVPWMAVLLQRRSLMGKESFEHFCGGSLIHPKVVLTAAHCMANHSELGEVEVRLGKWDTVADNEPLAHQQYGVRKMIVYENFTNRKFHNDLALLILKDNAHLNKNINLICLPSANDNFDEKRCIVSGWGKENFESEGKNAEMLKKVEVPVVPHRKCQRIFKSTRLGPFFKLHSSFMCAGGEAGVDICKGNGGSPLACKKGDRFVQAGIVSWGLSCGENGIPGAYVKVSNFVDWIRTTLQGEGIEL